MDTTTILKAAGVSKFFPGVKALSKVNFTLRRGEIHALMGENGAGKSTLIKVMTGVQKPNEGTILFNDKRISPKTPQEAQNIGISTVYQEINLCPNISVAENIFIGRLPKKNGKIDWNTMNEQAKQILERLHIQIDVSRLVSSYSIAIQQMIAIARAVDMSSGVLILDEPTSSLDSREVQELFKIMRKLKNEGMAIIFVSHFLKQVFEISDRMTVLRNGLLVGEYKTSELTQTQLVAKMVGGTSVTSEELPNKRRKPRVMEGQTFLKTNGLEKHGSIEAFDLAIRTGEVIGIAGLLGSGRTEMAKLIFGIDQADQGNITIDNNMMTLMYPRKAIKNGIAFCPEDRKVEGVVEDLTIRENIVLALQAKRGYFSYMPLKKQCQLAQKYIDLLKIKTPSMEQKIGNLSGGNQQKVILARWLTTNPKLLILDEPTRGIDIGAKGEIRRIILSLAAEGMTILLISSELEELVRCCDRVVILRDRSLIGQLEGDGITETKIMKLIGEGGVKAANEDIG
ncbi:monosaccharide ABC transporter ATP-binding protein (CUT2 family) [Scopulibacillus darangshiensis]|uniref:Monosaccharide ABC transporter ATP-binding protein (CUT2 family) n=1 Tax=Scopulibacillus darangshiensis TaxID=442528 RepID=A0A4R2P4A1_9BACL|nr:sugar ABC transporter ATP-binding protein [Scopulibacillus darangshiensis]TCP29563.1 monosaccharide ABC transporter ATP-binding protein (CUT2 family) [Scopulibacillus darangshiensis]